MFNKIYNSIYYRIIILREKIKFLIFPEDKYILVEGYPESRNFGDALNIPLIKLLSGKKVIFSKYVNSKPAMKRYSVIGSVLQSIPEQSIVWGSGMISDMEINKKLPTDIYAVRGPKSRNILKKNGYNCPQVYGDPALLLPLIFKPSVEKTYKIGIIPHYLDKKHPWIKKYSSSELINVIDLEVGTNYEKVIIELLKCEKIITSSLHGLIISYAYGLQSAWINLSDKIMGGNFKFHDFLLSINRDIAEPIYVNVNTDINKIEFPQNCNTEDYDVSQLINSCPFITNEMKDSLQKSIHSVNK